MDTSPRELNIKVKLGFELLCIEQGSEGSLYTVKFDDRSEDEYERFTGFASGETKGSYLWIEARLDDMLHRFGFGEHFFKTEKYPKRFGTLSRNTLRVYCHRFDDMLLVIAASGLKRGPKIADSPVLHAEFERAWYVVRRIEHRINVDRTLRVVGSEFSGDPVFQPVDQYGTFDET